MSMSRRQFVGRATALAASAALPSWFTDSLLAQTQQPLIRYSMTSADPQAAGAVRAYRAAVAAMKKAGIYEKVEPKLVYGENISQAAQFVQSGNAQAGIIALSLAISPPMKGGKSWPVPAEMHPAIEQAAIVLKSGKNKDAARAFLEFVKSKEGRATLEKFGFAIPKPDQGGSQH